jgi:hypothetical protein
VSAEAEPKTTAVVVRDDPFVSVEAMLRFKAAELRRRADESIAMLPTVEEPFKLPKPTDGLPDAAEWAFGEQTPHEVAKQSVESTLRFCLHWLNKTDAAIRDGDYPIAILCLMHAQGNYCHAWGPWRESAAQRTWRYVSKRRKALADFAAKGNRDRSKYTPKEKREWLGEWERLKLTLPVRSAAEVIRKKYDLAPSAFESIRKTIGRKTSPDFG